MTTDDELYRSRLRSDMADAIMAARQQGCRGRAVNDYVFGALAAKAGAFIELCDLTHGTERKR